MGKRLIKHLEITDLANGKTDSATWTPDQDYVIKYIIVRRADGKPWGPTTCTIFIEDQPLTKDKAPCAILGTDITNAIEWNEPIKKAQQFRLSITNAEGETITVYIDLILERP